MLDIQYIRHNPKEIKKACKDKGLNPDVVDRLLTLDQKRRALIQKVEQLRAQKNKLTQKDRLRGQKLKKTLKDLEPQLKKINQNFNDLMLQIPSVPLKEVPVGQKETDNQVVKTWGQKPKFDFKPKNHIQLGESLDLIDLQRGAKVSGYRGYFLKNQAVLLQMALMHYALNKLIQKGFTPMIPPIIVKKRSLINTGHFPWGELDIYKTFDDQAEQEIRYLAGTAEVPLVSYHQDETLNQKDLPLLYAGFSPCYRREIGNYGKDTRGLYRIHEFFKIEQVVIAENDPKESLKWLEKLLSYAEEILKDLKLPYRVMLMNTKDMGEPQIKKYDIETWMPGRKNYGETMSDSFMGEFQSRRANIKYQTKDGQIQYAHLLNNTAIASPRILIAIFENYQTKQGYIKIPQVLQPYLNQKIIKPK